MTALIRIATPDQLAHWAWLSKVDEAVVARFLVKCAEATAPDFLDAASGPCQLWTGGQSKGGKPEHRLPYGTFHVVGNVKVRAHIFAALVLGSWQDAQHVPGYHVDHRCKRTLCVAPLHLEPVPAPVNQARRWYGCG